MFYRGTSSNKTPYNPETSVKRTTVMMGRLTDSSSEQFNFSNLKYTPSEWSSFLNGQQNNSVPNEVCVTY